MICQVNTQAQSLGAELSLGSLMAAQKPATSLSLSVTPTLSWLPSPAPQGCSWPTSFQVSVVSSPGWNWRTLVWAPTQGTVLGVIRSDPALRTLSQGQGMSPHGLQACPRDRGGTLDPCVNGWPQQEEAT